MLVYSLPDPDPASPRTRYVLAVKYNGHSTYAAFRNGSYEFEVDELLHDRLQRGTLLATFEMDDGRPMSIVLADYRGIT